jgi:hypothetical protein
MFAARHRRRTIAAKRAVTTGTTIRVTIAVLHPRAIIAKHAASLRRVTANRRAAMMIVRRRLATSSAASRHVTIAGVRHRANTGTRAARRHRAITVTIAAPNATTRAFRSSIAARCCGNMSTTRAVNLRSSAS